MRTAVRCLTSEFAPFLEDRSKNAPISMKPVLVAALLQLSSLGCFTIADAQEKFTVEDSIELTRFNDPDPRASGEAKLNISPDRKYLAVVTTRGVIASDELESRLLIFDLSSVGVEGDSHESDPFQPIRSITASRRTQVRHGDYGSIITSVIWGSRPDIVYYLAEAEDGRRDLYRLRVDNNLEPERISDGKSSVTSFGERSGSLVFTATAPYVERPGIPGSRKINASAYDITGVSIAQLIVPEQWDKIEQANPELYALEAGGAPLSVKPVTGAGLYSHKFAGVLDPAISPDGGRAIVLATAPASPPEWQEYEVGYSEIPAGPATEEMARSHRWPAIYAIADLELGTFKPLVNAPIGRFLGYFEAVAASWSEDGERVAITNVFRPRSAGQHHDTKDPRPCSVAIIEVGNQEFSCLLESRSGIGDESVQVWAVRFIGKTQLEVTISSVSDKGETTRETSKQVYERRNGQWREAPAASTVPEQEPPTFDIVLKQDVNVPPALWFRKAGESDRFLWTPTPGLDLSESAVEKEFVWSDSNGYRWKGTLLTPAGYRRGVKSPLIVQTHSGYSPNKFFTDGAYTSGYAGQPIG